MLRSWCACSLLQPLCLFSRCMKPFPPTSEQGPCPRARHYGSRDCYTNTSPQSPTSLLATSIPRSNVQDGRELRIFPLKAYHTSLSSNCPWEVASRTTVSRVPCSMPTRWGGTKPGGTPHTYAPVRPLAGQVVVHCGKAVTLGLASVLAAQAASFGLGQAKIFFHQEEK